MHEDDARDIGIHDSIDLLVTNIMRANGWTRRQALSRLVGFLENDPDSPKFTTTAGPSRKRRMSTARAIREACEAEA